MKHIINISILAAFLFFIGCSTEAKDNLKWYDSVEKAVEVAKKENKSILVNFTGSDWCIWCKRLSAEVFSQKEFADYANKNLVLVKIDFPQNIQQSEATKAYNNQLAQVYRIEGFPTIVLLNKSGNVITYTGYQQGGAGSLC